MTRWFLLVAVVSSVACSGGSSGSGSIQATSDSSSGGEECSEEQRERAPEERAIRSSEAPIPVPLPGIARDSMRPELQQLWIEVEQALALVPPDPPVTADEDEIAAWASGPFTAWIRERVVATREAEAIAVRLADPSPVERGFAVALISFAFEDMAATARGAPVPQAIASDSGLLAVYAEAIDRALIPIAQYAAVGFEGCAQIFAQSQDAAWAEWPGFCASHLEDLREVFGRYVQPADSESSR